MRKFLVAMGAAAMLFAACGDDSSSSTGPNDESGVESSSSSGKVTEPAEVTSSSSEKAKSSSSWSSEGTIGSSSSSVEESSSSIVTAQSSSNGTESSSSSSEVNCSALLEGEAGWSWDVPKECRFNPDIDYGTMTDERDGKTYKTVKIGVQTWMAENLNFDPGQGSSGENMYDWSWCYNDEPKNCEVAGRFYTWAAAIDSVKLATDAKNPQDCGLRKECRIAAAGSTTLVQGVCPPDWHLPTETEWSALFTAVDRSTSGEVLRSQTGWHFNGNGTDAFGFSALPAGRRYYDGRFDGGGADANFWSATENGYNSAHVMRLYYNYEIAYLNTFGKDNGFSVRCVKN